MTSDPRGSFTTADLKVSYRLRKHCSLSARPPSPRSGPPLTTNRVGSPPVWESITLTFRQSLFVMCVRTVCKDYLMDTICNRQTCMFQVAQCETESKHLKRRYLPNQCHASYLSLDTTCDILSSASHNATDTTNGPREPIVLRNPTPITTFGRGGQIARADHPRRNP